jgi:hypothetical protein
MSTSEIQRIMGVAILMADLRLWSTQKRPPLRPYQWRRSHDGARLSFHLNPKARFPASGMHLECSLDDEGKVVMEWSGGDGSKVATVVRDLDAGQIAKDLAWVYGNGSVAPWCQQDQAVGGAQ